MTTVRTFTLQNLAGEETIISFGTHDNWPMLTLGHLRAFVHRKWKVPVYLQRYICSGKEYHLQDDAVSLETMIPEISDGEDRVAMVFIEWMRDKDYIEVNSGMPIMECQLEVKRRSFEEKKRSFDVVTVACYRKIAERQVIRHHRYCAERDHYNRRGPLPDDVPFPEYT